MHMHEDDDADNGDDADKGDDCIGYWCWGVGGAFLHAAADSPPQIFHCMMRRFCI